MSPIFNHHALCGLSSSTLGSLRIALHHALGSAALAPNERAQLHAALQAVDTVLHSRAVPPTPSIPSPSP